LVRGSRGIVKKSPREESAILNKDLTELNRHGQVFDRLANRYSL